ncbi:MAG: serine/threonine protein kinase [Sandaracinaceae bacterium]|nr:serine/threonine protein kinase [Sandaracinaceae bacterium]
MARRPPLGDAPTRDIGPYRLAHRIAVGSVAEVYRALLPQAAGGDRSVVIKRMLPELASDPARRAMFDAEVRLASRVTHPNVVAVLDHGLDDGVPYMVLEYVFGVDLRRLLRWQREAGRATSVATSVWLATQLLDGLDAVHALRDERGDRMRVVHRDVSPSNVFLSVHGDVKLGDLGIARPTQRPGGVASRAKGKLGYLAPEQVEGRDDDPRADVFSAATVLAELLAGRPLFSGATEIAVLLAIRDADLAGLRDVVPRLPEGLGRALVGALARRPEDRTASAAALRDALAPFVAQPVALCRAELGALVVGALDASTAAAEEKALHKTLEAQPGFGRDPATDSEHPRYAVDRAGAPVGEFALAELVRAVTTGEVEATDRLLEPGGPRRVLETIPELAAFLPSSRRTPDARRRTTLRETAERWDLAERSLVAVLGELLRARETGLLLCEAGAIQKELYLERGVPAFVTSNQPGDLLGEALVEAGVIARHELALALAALPHYEGRLGEALVGMGLIEPVALVHHLDEHARERLLSTFEWRDGTAAFYRDLEPPRRAHRIVMEPWAILAEGMRRRLGRGDAGPVTRRGRRLVAARPLDAPPGALQALLTACAAPRAFDELARANGEPDVVAERIALLCELGALEWRDEAPEA